MSGDTACSPVVILGPAQTFTRRSHISRTRKQEHLYCIKLREVTAVSPVTMLNRNLLSADGDMSASMKPANPFLSSSIVRL